MRYRQHYHDRAAERGRGERGGMTLVELLVVLFVIAILVSLVVGVSSYITTRVSISQTQATQTVVNGAIQAYVKAQDAPPAHPTSALYDVILQGDSEMIWKTELQWEEQDVRAYVRSLCLFHQLVHVPESARELQHLGVGEALEQVSLVSGNPASNYTGLVYTTWFKEWESDWGRDANAPPRAFMDGFGKHMDYKRNEGLGGNPVLISAGEDGRFGDRGSDSPILRNAVADNVRSDNRNQ